MATSSSCLCGFRFHSSSFFRWRGVKWIGWNALVDPSTISFPLDKGRPISSLFTHLSYPRHETEAYALQRLALQSRGPQPFEYKLLSAILKYSCKSVCHISISPAIIHRARSGSVRVDFFWRSQQQYEPIRGSVKADMCFCVKPTSWLPT